MFKRNLFSSGTEVEHPDRYAEYVMSGLVARTTRKVSNYRRERQSLLVEQANLKARIKRIDNAMQLSSGAFDELSIRVMLNRFMLVVTILASVALHVGAFIRFSQLQPSLTVGPAVALAVLIAMVLGGGVAFCLEQLLRAVRDDGEMFVTGNQSLYMPAIMFIFAEAALVAVALMEGAWIEATTGAGLVVWSFVAMTVFLPPMAGLFLNNAMQWAVPYRSTKSTRAIRDRMARIAALLRRFTADEELAIQEAATEAYGEVVEHRAGTEGHDPSHWSHSFDSFLKEVRRRVDAGLNVARYRPDVMPMVDMEPARTVRTVSVGDGAARRATPRQIEIRPRD